MLKAIVSGAIGFMVNKMTMNKGISIPATIATAFIAQRMIAKQEYGVLLGATTGSLLSLLTVQDATLGGSPATPQPGKDIQQDRIAVHITQAELEQVATQNAVFILDNKDGGRIYVANPANQKIQEITTAELLNIVARIAERTSAGAFQPIQTIVHPKFDAPFFSGLVLAMDKIIQVSPGIGEAVLPPQAGNDRAIWMREVNKVLGSRGILAEFKD